MLISRPLLPIIGLTAALAGAARAEDRVIPAAHYPALPATATSAQGFAPPGWTVEAQAAGDLNKDGVSDLAFVLHEANAANVVANPQGLGAPSFDTNPRILAAAFGSAGGEYRLALENHTLIPRRDIPTLDDAFDPDGGLTLARGAFTVRLGFFSSAGGWEMATTTLTFRYQNGRFELIGAERDSTMRNTGAMVQTSANYSTGRVTIETGSIENDATKSRTQMLPKDQRHLTVEEVGDGLVFDPGGP